jgi:hypothetical protein
MEVRRAIDGVSDAWETLISTFDLVGGAGFVIDDSSLRTEVAGPLVRNVQARIVDTAEESTIFTV